MSASRVARPKAAKTKAKTKAIEPVAAAPRGAVRHEDGRLRCAWCGTDPLYIRYHDTEWGVPVHDDRRLFEMLCLEGAQAGLSWITILRKRENYRRAFDRFDAKKMARYTPAKSQALLADPGIVRNRLKVQGFILNARAYLETRESEGSFDRYLWQFAPAVKRRRRPRFLGEFPAATPESDAMSKDLKRRGFKFIGTTICYAFMQ
ncbi:MAG: DNA-3-methyladenine glycosylase I, partial [Gammaproteobacteria bacterium]